MFLQSIIYIFGILFSAINFSEGVKYDGASNNSYLPVVLWHGMGDSCCFSFSLGRIMNLLRDEMPNVYIKSIRIGNNEVEDVKNSYLGDVNAQVDQVCEELSQDPQLKTGYNAIGFSQGGQFLRAVAQRCPHPRMYNLISLGGQHQGVYGIPNCMSLPSRMCDYIREKLTYAAYTESLQKHIIQAGYWHDPLNAEEYKTKNRFLADINNEKDYNAVYVKNLKKLKKLVLVKFMNDTMVYPPESEWFGFYKDGTTTKVQSLKETSLYKEDRLGLQKMIAHGQIDFLALPEDHLRFDEDWFIENIVNRYLKIRAGRRTKHIVQP